MLQLVPVGSSNTSRNTDDVVASRLIAAMLERGDALFQRAESTRRARDRLRTGTRAVTGAPARAVTADTQLLQLRLRCGELGDDPA